MCSVPLLLCLGEFMIYVFSPLLAGPCILLGLLLHGDTLLQRRQNNSLFRMSGSADIIKRCRKSQPEGRPVLPNCLHDGPIIRVMQEHRTQAPVSARLQDFPGGQQLLLSSARISPSRECNPFSATSYTG